MPLIEKSLAKDVVEMNHLPYYCANKNMVNTIKFVGQFSLLAGVKSHNTF